MSYSFPKISFLILYMINWSLLEEYPKLTHKKANNVKTRHAANEIKKMRLLLSFRMFLLVKYSQTAKPYPASTKEVVLIKLTTLLLLSLSLIEYCSCSCLRSSKPSLFCIISVNATSQVPVGCLHSMLKRGTVCLASSNGGPRKTLQTICNDSSPR